MYLVASALVLVLIKGLLLVGVELGKDEVAYWYWASHHLDASYALVLLTTIRLSDMSVPGSDLFLRMPFVLGGVAAAWLLNSACKRAALAPQDRLFALLAFVTSHWAWHTGSFLHPDGVLVPIWLATLAAAHRAEESGRERDWLITGVLAGLTCLCKYTGCILAAGLILALALRRDGFRRLLLVGIPCTLVAFPLLSALWDLDFHLPFTLGSLSQVAAEQSVGWRVCLFLLAPLLYLSPPLLWILYEGVLTTWRRRSEKGMDLLLLPALCLFGTFGFFAIVNGQVKGNWVLPGFLGLWPFAFHGLRRRRFHKGWWAALLVVGIAQSGVPATTLRWPQMAEWLVSMSPATVDATYPAIVSPTDLPREPTFSWTERVCEYHGWSEFGQNLSLRLQHSTALTRESPNDSTVASGRPRVSSAEYGLGFGLSRYLPGRPLVTIEQDERFAHIADVEAQESALYITRRGSDLPSSILHRQPRLIGQIERRDRGCDPVDYQIYELSAASTEAADMQHLPE